MIGTSGPSSSTRALSMPSPARAAIRCSMVATRDAGGVAERRCTSCVSTTWSPARRHAVVAVGDVGADEDDAGVGRPGAASTCTLRAGVHADAGECIAVPRRVR